MSYCIWLTGLSGAGKTTIGKELAARQGIVHLDGDVLRGTVCKDLGFSPVDRDVNIARVVTIASYLVHTGRSVVCSFISPYEIGRIDAVTRIPNCKMVWVACPLEICEARDVKGLYAKARSGELKGFTGIDAPYDTPRRVDLILSTDVLTVDACVLQIKGLVDDMA